MSEFQRDPKTESTRNFFKQLVAGGVALSGVERIAQLAAGAEPEAAEITTPCCHVYYGSRPANAAQNKQFKDAIGQDLLVVEPGNFPAAPNNHSYAYFSSTGVNVNNNSLKPLLKTLTDKNLLLGMEDPNGPGTQLVDLRKPEARKEMINYLMKGMSASKYEGVMLDAVASAEILEQNNPVKFKGLADAAVTLVEELAEKLHAMKPKGRKLIVNGIMENNELMTRIGKATDMFMCESQCSNSGTLRTEQDNAWTQGKLGALAKGAAEAKHKVGVIFVEPGALGNTAMIQKEAPGIAKKLLAAANETAGEACLTGAGLYVCPQAHFQNFEAQPASDKPGKGGGKGGR